MPAAPPPPPLTPPPQVKDKTIEQLAAALQARDEALEKHLATVASLRVRSAGPVGARAYVRAAP